MTLEYIEAILMIALAMASMAAIYVNLVLHQRKYAQHVVFGDQPTKAQSRILAHPYIYFGCIVLLVLFYDWLLTSHLTGFMQQFFFGAFIAIFAMVLGQAVGGILVFLYSIRNPEKISGQTVFADPMFRMLHAQLVFMPCLFLLAALAIVHHTPFILGSLAAAVAIESLCMLRGIRKASA